MISCGRRHICVTTIAAGYRFGLGLAERNNILSISVHLLCTLTQSTSFAVQESNSFVSISSVSFESGSMWLQQMDYRTQVLVCKNVV